jgi:glutamine amidotransferase
LFAEALAHGFTAQNAFAHLRYATVGDIETTNVHPFACRDNGGREWVLMHQGTLFDFDGANGYFHTQTGSTDSERILLYLVDKINIAEKAQGRPLGKAQRFDLLETVIREMAPGNKINLAIYDGEQIYLHSNYANSLYLHRENDTLFFCTVPLTQARAWDKLPLNTLFALQDGEIVRSGTPHNSTYMDTEDDIRRLYEVYANL